MRQQKREKINQPEHIAGHSQNKGTEQVQRRARRLQTGPAPPQAGGRGGERGRLGLKDRSPYRAANRPPVSNQTPPEVLDGRHPPGGSRRDTGRRHPTRAGGDWAGDAEGRRRAAPGESAPVKRLAAWAALTGKARKAGAAFCSGLLWNTRGLEPRATQGPLHVERLGAWAVPAPPRSARELATWIRVHLCPPVSGRKLGTEETGKQKPNKQREPLQKGPVQQIKIPVGNTGRGLQISRSVSWNKELSETEPTHTDRNTSREIPRYIFTFFFYFFFFIFSLLFSFRIPCYCPIIP